MSADEVFDAVKDLGWFQTEEAAPPENAVDAERRRTPPGPRGRGRRAGLRGPKLLRLLLLFTAMGPLGCVAGLGLHARFGKLFGGALDGALIALTAGTFVYVGATEVVPEEFEDGGASRAKVLALLLGVATILGLARVADLLEARAG